MAFAADCYKNGLLLGSGTATAASATISSFTAVRTVGQGRNITMVITETGAQKSRHWHTRVMTDGGTSLTLRDACPYA